MSKIIEDKAMGGRMIFHCPPPSNPEAVTQGILGVSVAQLVQDILRNPGPGGKYDALYVKEETN